MIASLEKTTRLAEKEEQEMKKYLQMAEELYHDLKKAMEEYKNKKDELYENARLKAKEIVDNARREAEDY